MQHSDFSHGNKSYRTIPSIGGVRHLVALRPTIRPYCAESGPDFERRMERLEALMLADPSVTSVTLHFRHAGQAISECELDIQLIPEPQPILDLTPIATTRAAPRGARGRGRGVLVLA